MSALEKDSGSSFDVVLEVFTDEALDLFADVGRDRVCRRQAECRRSARRPRATATSTEAARTLRRWGHGRQQLFQVQRLHRAGLTCGAVERMRQETNEGQPRGALERETSCARPYALRCP